MTSRRQVLEQLAAKGGAIQLAGSELERELIAMAASPDTRDADVEDLIKKIARLAFIIDGTMIGVRAEMKTLRHLAARQTA